MGCYFLIIGQWIYDFQTLIAGILAVGAALYAARFAQKQVGAANLQIEVAREQIAAVKEQADQERAAKLRAARASLPTTLSSICEYAQEAGEALYAAWPVAAKVYPDDHDPHSVQSVKADIPSFPYELLDSLERIVELTDAEDVAERIESILREAQVFSARTRPLVSGTNIDTDVLAIHIIQAAALYARAESLFTYARRKTNGVNSADLWDRVFAALLVWRVYEPRILDEAKNQRGQGLPPGEADSVEPE
ncbi:type II secretory pathway pseudopilin PulG [Sphingobium sp. B2D3A]|uniref:hypothetical protein n=1 Tax=unclassified Sphingobium TaxID=2611147 RepID=UPI002225AB9C|nr:MULTISPECIES: hypothetical protein [unclassified Sphingobium]MCW2339113.1 type II secretory pathway pseudopilin PulG [Sphingobium sp. B2D3A]